MSQSVLLVEDEDSIADFQTVLLSREGYTVHRASDGKLAVQLFDAHRPDVVLLDLRLPGLGGLDVLREIRKMCEHTPVVVVSVKDDEAEKVAALELGADDYVTKPFAPRELVARVRARLRHQARSESLQSHTSTLGELEVDWHRAELTRRGVKIFLTAKEFELLRLLFDNRDRVMTRELVVERVWGYDFEGDERVVDTTVKRLRKKVGGRLIETVRGLGYRLGRMES